jgi:hypothetical protein
MEPLLAFLALFLLYNLPGILMIWREVPGAGVLFFINLLTAWTGVGWVWALSLAEKERARDAFWCGVGRT